MGVCSQRTLKSVVIIILQKFPLPFIVLSLCIWALLCCLSYSLAGCLERSSSITKNLSVSKVCVMVLGVKHGPHFSCLPFLTLVSCFFSQIAEHIRIFFLPLHPKIWLRMDRRSTPQECSRPQLMLATPSLASPMAYQLMVRLTQMIASSC